eukprot:363062-Chlamydomonas_euryale.AAC.9
MRRHAWARATVQLRDEVVRTQDPWEASLFMIPTYMLRYGGMGYAEHPTGAAAHVLGLIDHVRKAWPFWNRTGGADHFFWCGQILRFVHVTFSSRVIHCCLLLISQPLKASSAKMLAPMWTTCRSINDVGAVQWAHKHPLLEAPMKVSHFGFNAMHPKVTYS